MGLRAAGCDLAVDGGAVGWNVTTESGRTYFFRIKNSDRNSTVTGFALMGGIAGAAIGSAVTAGKDNPGPVDFIPLDQASARTTLASLQLAD